MTNGKVLVDLGELQQQIVAELQRALGEEAELERMLAQKRTEIAARRGQLDLLAHLAQQGQQQQQQPQQPKTEALPKPAEMEALTEPLPEPAETEALPNRTARGRPKE